MCSPYETTCAGFGCMIFRVFRITYTFLEITGTRGSLVFDGRMQ